MTHDGSCPAIDDPNAHAIHGTRGDESAVGRERDNAGGTRGDAPCEAVSVAVRLKKSQPAREVADDDGIILRADVGAQRHEPGGGPVEEAVAVRVEGHQIMIGYQDGSSVATHQREQPSGVELVA